MSSCLLAELVGGGVRLEPHEAVAIAQQLIRRGAAAPSIHNIRLHEDGTAECIGCDATPAVYEVAILLQGLLPAERIGIPGGLRYAIARGLHEVEARPFDSLAEFSAALQRFERGDRRAVVADLVRRASAVHASPITEVALAGPPPVHPSGAGEATSIAAIPIDLAPRATDVAREDADGAHRPSVSLAVPATPRRRRWRASAVAAALVGCLGGSLATAGLMTWARREAPPRVHTATVAPSIAATPASPRAPNIPAEPRPAVSAPAPHRPRARTIVETRNDEAQEAVVAAVDAQRRPVFSPAFASNGSALFFHTGSSRDDRSAIATSNIASGYDLQVMTIVDDGARNYHVQPSPDGRSIAFVSDRDGERGVYVARRDGTDVRRVSGGGYAAVPTWSPDGRRIAYIRAEPSNPKVWNLWLQSVDGGDAARLTSYRYGQTWSASWFPDGRRICYSHEDALVILDLDTGRQMIFRSPVKGRLVRTPAVSPDGTRVIFQVFRQGAWMLNLADRSMRFVLTDPTAEEFAWAPDGRHVAFHSRRDGQWGIYVIAG